MLPLIISCTRSWNFAWHLLWRSTTESKNIVKLLAISQTIHTVCCEDDYFPKRKFELFNSLFHSVYLVFPKSLFSIAVRYLYVCNEDKWCVVTPRAAVIRVAWLVYVRTYCVSIVTLNQNKWTRLLYLGDAQLINVTSLLRTLRDQVNTESRSGESAKGDRVNPSGWWAMQSDFK